MSIDWITVAAQLLNFLVLVWLLKRFLYRPILDGIEARELEIAERMSESTEIRQQAESTINDYQQQREALHQARSSTIEQVRQEALKERDSLLQESHQRMREEQEAVKKQQQQQQTDYVNQLHTISAQTLLQVISKAVSELSDESFEERLVVHALLTLDQQRAGTQAAATPLSGSELVITTRNCLPDSAKNRIRDRVNELWAIGEMRFSADPEQSDGALVQYGSLQVEWTVDSYVKELQTLLDDALKSQISDDDNGAAS